MLENWLDFLEQIQPIFSTSLASIFEREGSDGKFVSLSGNLLIHITMRVRFSISNFVF
jgi:hypothetical protein